MTLTERRDHYAGGCCQGTVLLVFGRDDGASRAGHLHRSFTASTLPEVSQTHPFVIGEKSTELASVIFIP